MRLFLRSASLAGQRLRAALGGPGGAWGEGRRRLPREGSSQSAACRSASARASVPHAVHSPLSSPSSARCSRAVSPSRVTARDRSFPQKPRIRSMDDPGTRPQRPRTFKSRRRKRHWFRDSRKTLLARAEASREETGGASGKRASDFQLPASGVVCRRAEGGPEVRLVSVGARVRLAYGRRRGLPSPFSPRPARR